MILKFDTPMDIQEARLHYNDSVSFISSPDSYPKISAIEFNGDPKLIFKRDAIEPKITKRLNKIIKAYERKITRVWNRSFKEVKEAVPSVVKAEVVKTTDEQKKKAHEAVAGLITAMADAAEKPYKAAYETGKLRGQVISGQEIDPEVTAENEADIQDLLDNNASYLTEFGNDINDGLDEVLDEEYDSPEALTNAIDTKVKEPKFSRALMYAAAILGAAVVGTINSLKDAKPAEGHRAISGGIWIIHPDEGKGGEVCDGCEANSGKWFSLEDFLSEYGQQNCLSHCRCDLRYGEQIIAP
jgi:hypothetical protein